jgi:general L-amino acid transport system substrate-binding protein
MPAWPASPPAGQPRHWQGLDVDLCRGLAVAIFNDASRCASCRSPRRNASLRSARGRDRRADPHLDHDMLRDTTLGIRHVAPYFYDGHGFMVKRDSGITRARAT